MEAGSLAPRVRAAREAAGLSQEAAAKRAGLAVKTWRRIEAGEDTTLGTLSQVAAALGMTVPELLQFERPHPAEAAS